jgi:superfamily II DNA or RNA helicase
MSVFDLDKVFWSAPRIVQTPKGRRRVRTWTIPKNSPFWGQWRAGAFRGGDYSVSKWQGQWMVTEWRVPNGEEDTAAPAAENEGVDQPEAELPPRLQRRFDKIIVPIYNRIREETGEDYSYQFPSIKRLVLAVLTFDGALDASDTGTGKTPVACAVARILNRRLFVVCPKNVLPPWQRMADLFGVRLAVINYEMLRTGRTEYGYWAEDHGNRKRAKPFRKFVFDSLDSASFLFVFDECHRMKDYKTLNCALGVAAIDAQYKVLALSATAADNPMHMKFVALLTGLIRHPSHFYGWMTQHGVHKGRFGLVFNGSGQVLSRIHRKIFPLHGSRIRIADLGDRFPQTRIISEAYAMEDPQQINAIYEEMRKEIEKLKRAKASDRGANILTQQLRARQQVELLKVPTFKAMVEDGIEEGMSVVAILNFSDSVIGLARRLRTTNLITGDVPSDERQRLIDRFNQDEESLIVMNIKAGGLGISLHGTVRSRPRLVLISPTFSGIDLKQALGRCHRAGGARSIQKIVWAAGTVEQHACDKVRARLQRVSIFNDDQLDDALAI